LWMHHVKPQRVEWPTTNGNKPQSVSLAKEARPLLLPVTNYVLLRRFSAKEEPRRLIAAPFLANDYHYQWLGLENHLNYIYRRQGELKAEETLGLSALFNSALVDRYFRIVNGNTQVNAAELRVLPLPPLELIKQIGGDLLTWTETGGTVDIDAIIFSSLREYGYLSPDFPLIRETRISMGKIQEAQDILKILGLPPAQQNEISALTLLTLAQLSEGTPWSEAKRQSLRIHDILVEIKERYGREYAENTRETIRRQVIHQFEQAGIVGRNPDDPTLATNSPRTHYALSDAAIRTIRAYRSKNWEQAVRSFHESQGALFEIYQTEIPGHLIHFNGDRFLGSRV
jgi:adenine-specific DNA-methyltransferase